MSTEIKHALLRVLPFLFAILLLSLSIKRGKINADEIGLKKPKNWKIFILYTAGFFTLVVVLELLFYQIGILTISKWSHGILVSAIRIIGAIVLAPIAEEIIFRGVLLNLLHKKLKSLHLSVAIQSILFVLMHNFAYENSLSANIGILQSLMDASLFAYARHYTQSLYTPILMHMSGNFVAVFERILFY